MIDLIKSDDIVAFIQQPSCQMKADKAGASCDENVFFIAHEIPSFSLTSK